MENKKKVGILTFHGAHNYGSVLQSYASYKVLDNLGYDVSIINLRNKEQLNAYRILPHKINSLGKIFLLAFRLVIYPQLKRQFIHFENFINKVLPTTKDVYGCGTEIRTANLDYDIYYVGSDQVWNPACQDFESAYYLDFAPRDKLKISYAPSLGKAEFCENDLKLIKRLLMNIDYISCREEKGATLLRTLTDKPVVHVCDPVILLGVDGWKNMSITPKYKKPYILMYFLNNNHGNRNLIKYFKEKTGYEVISITPYIKDFFNPNIHGAYASSPAEFVGLIQNASLVYTNSFHATAFSVMFNRPFYTAIAASTDVANNNDSRKVDFLHLVGLTQRLVKDGTIPNLSLNVDFTNANVRLASFRKLSMSYLKSALDHK